jgi:ABC-type antimicrobial peptide transport system permease subunit
MLHARQQLNHFNPSGLFTKLPLAVLVFSNLTTALKSNNMHYTYLILLPDFLQVLYSIRKISTKDYYFSKYIQFSTIYLILEQNLNTEIILGRN